MTPRRLLCALMAGVLVFAGDARAEPKGAAGPTWRKDLAAARAEAVKAGKPMLIVIEDGT